MIKLLWAWLATRAASFWIAAASGAIIALGVAYIQNLRIQAAHCQAKLEIQAALEELTEEAREGIRREVDEDIEAGRQAQDPCLDAPIPDELTDRLRD